MTKTTKWIFALAAVSIVAAPVIYVWNYEQESQKREAKAVQTIQSLGYPVTVADYEKTRPPTNQNAAPILLELSKDWKTKLVGKFPTGDKPGSPKHLAFLRDNAKLIDSLDRVRDRPVLWFEFQPNNIEKTELLSRSREWARSLMGTARLEASEGRHASARRRVETARALQKLYYHEGTLIGLLVGMANRSIINVEILRIIQMTKDLEAKRVWRTMLEDEFVAPNLGKSISQELLFNRTLTFDDLQGYDLQGLDAQLIKLPQMKRRIIVINLEPWADIVEFAKDGRYTSEESRIVDQRQMERLDREPLGRKILDQYSGIISSGLTVDEAEASHNLVLSVADYLVELGGGPKAQPRGKVKMQQTPDGAAFWSDDTTRAFQITRDEVMPSSRDRLKLPKAP